ncbi:peptidase M15 [Patescibacteria group bacterium]|nr:peptidase M15 [Patescibacteria group bacterium]
MTERNPKFACPCCGENRIDLRIENLFDQLEALAGEKLMITSGCRCEAHNRAVGGANTSSHLAGLAVDISCKLSYLRFRIVGAAIRLGFNRIGIGKNFIHLDIDSAKAARVIWMY